MHNVYVNLFIFLESTCQYEAPDGYRCFLHESPLFGDWINMLTAGLILIGVIFEVILLFSIGDLLLYGDEELVDVYRPIEMNTYRNGDSVNPPPVDQQFQTIENDPEPEVYQPTAALLHNYLQSIPPPQRISPPNSEVTYAQIQRHNAENGGSQLDFRLQTPRSDGNSSNASDYRSTTSGAYTSFQPLNRQISNRPQSPETNF